MNLTLNPHRISSYDVYCMAFAVAVTGGIINQPACVAPREAVSTAIGAAHGYRSRCNGGNEGPCSLAKFERLLSEQCDDTPRPD